MYTLSITQGSNAYLCIHLNCWTWSCTFFFSRFSKLIWNRVDCWHSEKRFKNTQKVKKNTFKTKKIAVKTKKMCPISTFHSAVKCKKNSSAGICSPDCDQFLWKSRFKPSTCTPAYRCAYPYNHTAKHTHSWPPCQPHSNTHFNTFSVTQTCIPCQSHRNTHHCAYPFNHTATPPPPPNTLPTT